MSASTKLVTRASPRGRLRWLTTGAIALALAVLWLVGCTTSTPTSTPTSGIYGTGFNSDTLANLNMGGQRVYTPSYRFEAAQSSPLSAIRIHLLGPDHGPGYGGGTGGRIR